MTAPEPFTALELEAVYMAMQLLLARSGALLSFDARAKTEILMYKVREHFIALGGDPAELD